IRGFAFGIVTIGGSGHMVEDNLLDGNLRRGLYIFSTSGQIRRNRVFNTGNSTDFADTTGITGFRADILDNIVQGLAADVAGGSLEGIVYGTGSRVRGNHVSGFDMAAAQGGNVANAVGIKANQATASAALSGNVVIGPGAGSISGTGLGIDVNGNVRSFCI